jgi:hypothetical protein
MKYTKWVVILALAVGACSERSAPPAAATSAKQAGAPETAAPTGQVANPQMPNPALAAAAPSPSASDSAPAPSLKPKYPDKTAFLADVKAAKPVFAVKLDSETVAEGFGPPMRYRMNKDGSVTR